MNISSDDAADPVDEARAPRADAFDESGVSRADSVDEARVRWADLVDEDDLIEAPGDLPDWVLDPAELHDVSLNDLEGVVVRGRMLIADQYRIIGDVLRNAEDNPDPWVGADPTLDPDWVDPWDRSVSVVRRERCEFAVRAATAEVAARLHLSEATVRVKAGHTVTLRERCPHLWALFLGGGIQEANAVTAAQLAASLPHDDPDSWAAFDTGVIGAAERLTPSKFRTRARVIRERVHNESLEQRHCRAAVDRRVWATPELDGMATLTALLPADKAHHALARVDAYARHLHGQDGDDRTLAQLRADVFADLLTDLLTDATLAGAAGTAGPAGAAGAAGVAVAITVPVLTLLGHSDEPATLDGYGPIDLDTAKRLAGSATSWVRVLTHPVTGTVLDLDRTTYRVPKALRRWLGVRHPTCVFPGCARPARNCDIDHLTEWHHGGTTKADNLAPECENHHRLRHGSLWDVRHEPESGQILWTSPHRRTFESDPPPF